MAACSECKKPITSTQAKNAVKVYNEKNQLIGMMHFKCRHVARKKLERVNSEVPDAYTVAGRHRTKDDANAEIIAARERADAELAALHQRQHELAEQRSLEEVPKGFADYRDPMEADLSQLVPSSGEVTSLDDVMGDASES